MRPMIFLTIAGLFLWAEPGRLKSPSQDLASRSGLDCGTTKRRSAKARSRKLKPGSMFIVRKSLTARPW